MSNNENLVLDAIPSPPRIANNSDIPADCNNETNKDNEVPPQKEPNGPKENDGKKANPKKSRKSGSQGFTNIFKITKCSNLHFGPTVIVNNSHLNETSQKTKENIPLTADIQKLFDNQRLLNRQDLMFISNHMGKGWEDIARILNYSDGQIDQLNVNYINSGLKEVVYQFLLDWTRTKPKEATIGRLARLLWDSNQKDVVKRIIENQ